MATRLSGLGFQLKATTDNAIVYIFVGCIILDGGWLRIMAGTIVGLIGLGYCALEFAPQIEPPSNMRDADAGWGAEQV